ncbi:hypothetical protein [Micromonospora maris]|uniref:Uncharacterized protein n=1 Tax=Micromonospora maris TaxID=1003110 RepID=A0A9X0LE33_9ACTN|nr:hypothetical protein [Micromonospora maris]AEB47633.1 hypothetical protein VAB18032_02745 [Micromonospora maris AB-18-032]KUJ46673.1 hypothetical protein ADL17_27720 [Micromonospora maris]
MPATVPTDPRSKQLLTALFWGGVALAPVAALILLVADGNGPLRFAALLAILAVVLIGLSITLRGDNGHEQYTEELREELDELRRELRSEIVAAAQRGNQALDELQRVQQTLAGLRRTADAAGSSAGDAAPASAEPVGGGRARVAAPEPPPPAPFADRPTSTPFGERPEPAPFGDRPESAPFGDRPAPAPFGERPAPAGVGERQTRPGGVYGSAQPAGQGVVRHTETVHVTTRHTIVDGGGMGEVPRYGGYAAPWSAGERPRGGPGVDPAERHWPDGDERPRRDDDRAWSGPARDEHAAWSEPRDERPWSGPRDDRSTHRDDRSAHQDGSAYQDRSAYQDHSAYRDGPARHDASAHQGGSTFQDGSGYRDERDWAAPRDERGWGDGGQQWAAAAEVAPGPSRPDDTGEYWAQLRAGDRWAAVRDDERGRELRVGERHAEVNADHTGTEYRMADRWASVRHGEPRRAADGDEGWRDGRGEPERRPGLPAGGVPVPDEWRPPRQRGHQPEPSRAYQPEPARGYLAEPARGYQPEPAHGYQPEPEPYGRRHGAEDTGYGQPVQEPNNRWR